jgi:hypothetical protein
MNETLTVKTFSTDVVANGTDTLEIMIILDDNIKLSTTGPLRSQTFKKSEKEMMDLANDMRCQALCKAFALVFNALTGKEYSIDFIVVTFLNPKLEWPLASSTCLTSLH